MATKTLYKATLSTEAEAYSRTRTPGKGNVTKAGDDIVPYFVSGPLDYDVPGMNIVGYTGAFLHVLAWLLALALDIVLVTRLKPSEATDKHHFDYWLAAFIPLVVGLVVVLGATLVHSCTSMKIPPGLFPPFLMTAITGGALITVVFTYLLMTTSAAGLHGASKALEDAVADGDCTVAAGCDKVVDWTTFFTRCALWSLIAKIYIWQFLYNNQVYALSDK